MFTLRCTRKLLDRMRATPEAADRAPTTALGDWYANLLYHRRRQFILAVSERSLLTVLLDARDSASAPQRLVAAVGEMLEHIKIPPAVVARELDHMREATVGRTHSRVVLGAMNDIAFQFDYQLDAHPQATLHEHARIILPMPSKPLRYRSPIEVTRALLLGAEGGSGERERA